MNLSKKYDLQIKFNKSPTEGTNVLKKTKRTYVKINQIIS